MKGFRLRWTLVLLLALGTMVHAADPVWEEVRLRGRSYVTLESFAKFYGLTVPEIPNDDYFELKGKGLSVVFRPNSNECVLNGSKVWMSFPLGLDEQGRTLVSKADVIMLFEPLIHKEKAVPPRPFRGVILDPGHGGADNGARTRDGYQEKTAALDTARRLERMLKEAGIPSVMTRTTDVFITLEDRAAFTLRYPGYIFVSLHYNSGPRVSHGVETFALSPQGTPSTSSQGILRTSDLDSNPGNRMNYHNILLADFVHRKIALLHSRAGDRGVKRARFVVLRESHAPAVLVEGGFMSNTVDAGLISDGAYREKIAAAVYEGLKAYVRVVDPGHVWVRPPPTAPVPAPAPVPTPTPAPAPAPPPVAVPVPVPETSTTAPTPPQIPTPSTPPAAVEAPPAVPVPEESAAPAPQPVEPAQPVEPSPAVPAPPPPPPEPAPVPPAPESPQPEQEAKP
ncbi:MAG: N-acetylmuramoyl-L-alanine amidase [Candidatus Methylacidiphilales bacterium]|nr:N-acetylmuramoyl-L-alanine amidase [Candidatus Methylacidiphilales bacterium]